MNTKQERSIPRPEHPRPQFYRDAWTNLNGWWDFDFDFGNSKKERGWAAEGQYPHTILVPFCPESSLSGIGNKDFMNAVWYRRSFAVTEEQKKNRVLLHFGAVDNHCEVFVNGKPAGVHDGGYTSFCFDITALVHPGGNTLTVYASDNPRTGKQPLGKQSNRYESYGCLYTRTTGIWQTVWLEYVPTLYLTSAKLIPDPENSCVHVEAFLNGTGAGLCVEAEVCLEGTMAGKGSARLSGNRAMFSVPLDKKELWEPGHPVLYDLSLTLKRDGETMDKVSSYFGLRTVALSDGAILLNGRPVFQRLVLDQGFYPDGIYTARDDETLKRDILLSMKAGFNGARLHEKVFEERYLYWADRLGYLVWGEFPNWGLNISEADALCTVLPQWMEEVQRDFNHPAIVGWCPFNETWDCDGRRQDDRVLSRVYLATKAIDPTRPVIDTSGNYHVVTDIYDVHDYDQDPVSFAAHYGAGCAPYDAHSDRQQYRGEPYFVSEYGGTWWNRAEAEAYEAQRENEAGVSGWGYGARPRTEREAAERIAALTKILLGNLRICAFCYTQLTDVEQEQNGLYTYDREPKFSEEIYRMLREAFRSPAAIEEGESHV